jgi:6-methylsalicylate decarboxylase
MPTYDASGPSRREFLTTLAALGVTTVLPGGTLAAQASPAGNNRLIDVHHHFSPPFYGKETGGRAWSYGMGDRRMLQWTPQMSLAEMDKGGVGCAILSLTTPAVWYGDLQADRSLARRCNEYAAQLASDHPGRFGFFAAVPLPDTDGSLREITYALDTLKADGIGLLTSYADKWPGDPAFTPVFEELNRRRAVVYFHPTAPACCRDLIPSVPPPYIEFPHDTTRAVTSLLYSGSLARLRGVRFIFSHAGGTIPMLASRIAGLAHDPVMAEKVPDGVEYELKRLHYDIANSANRPAMSALMNLVPMSQIVFGSDYPFFPIGLTATGMTNLGLAASDLQAIGRDNAIGLLPRLKA